MKTKKTQGLSFVNLFIIALVVLIALIFLVVLINILTGKTSFNEFNPDKDVCLEWECCMNSNSNNCRDDISFVSCELLPNNGLHYNCKDWRPKTKCEIDPEAEGCICDEWELGVFLCDIKNRNDNSQLIKECKQINGIIKDGCCSPCISSHKPTIYDYSCQELFEHILKNNIYNYNTRNNKFYYSIATKSIWIKYYCTADLVDVYKEKGCFE